MLREGQSYSVLMRERFASGQEPFQVQKSRLSSKTQGSKLTPKLEHLFSTYITAHP